MFLCDNFATVSFDRYDGKDNNNIRAGDSELTTFHSSASIANYGLLPFIYGPCRFVFVLQRQVLKCVQNVLVEVMYVLNKFM